MTGWIGVSGMSVIQPCCTLLSGLLLCSLHFMAVTQVVVIGFSVRWAIFISLPVVNHQTILMSLSVILWHRYLISLITQLLKMWVGCLS